MHLRLDPIRVPHPLTVEWLVGAPGDCFGADGCETGYWITAHMVVVARTQKLSLRNSFELAGLASFKRPLRGFRRLDFPTGHLGRAMLR